jgi:hypothetical protein
VSWGKDCSGKIKSAVRRLSAQERLAQVDGGRLSVGAVKKQGHFYKAGNGAKNLISNFNSKFFVLLPAVF